MKYAKISGTAVALRPSTRRGKIAVDIGISDSGGSERLALDEGCRLEREIVIGDECVFFALGRQRRIFAVSRGGGIVYDPAAACDAGGYPDAFLAFMTLLGFGVYWLFAKAYPVFSRRLFGMEFGLEMPLFVFWAAFAAFVVAVLFLLCAAGLKRKYRLSDLRFFLCAALALFVLCCIGDYASYGLFAYAPPRPDWVPGYFLQTVTVRFWLAVFVVSAPALLFAYAFFWRRQGFLTCLEERLADEPEAPVRELPDPLRASFG